MKLHQCTHFSRPETCPNCEIDRLRTQLKSVEADAAVMRHVVEMWQEIGPDEESQQYVDAALANSAGKVYADRMQVAVDLLRETTQPPSGKSFCKTHPDSWISRRDKLLDELRRDAFLNPKPQDVK